MAVTNDLTTPFQLPTSTSHTHSPENAIIQKIRPLALTDLYLKEQAPSPPLSPNRVQVVNIVSSIEDTEAQEQIKRRCGKIWDCIGRKITEGGFIYLFKGNKKFFDTQNNFLESIYNETIEAIYPAIEPSPIKVRFKGFEGFGFGWDASTGILILPDREALLFAWDKYRKTKPNLPELKIAKGEKIEDDQTFIETFFDYDVIYSIDECVHDGTIHVIPTLNRLLAKNYSEERQRIKTLIMDMHTGIEKALMETEQQEIFSPEECVLIRTHLYKVQFILAYFIDIYSSKTNAIASHACNLSFLKQLFYEIWVKKEQLTTSVKSFLMRRFRTEYETSHLTYEEYQNLFNLIKAIHNFSLTKEEILSSDDTEESKISKIAELKELYKRCGKLAWAFKSIREAFPSCDPNEIIDVLPQVDDLDRFKRIAAITKYPLQKVVSVYKECGDNIYCFEDFLKSFPDHDPMQLAAILKDLDTPLLFIDIIKETKLPLERLLRIYTREHPLWYDFKRTFSLIPDCSPEELIACLREIKDPFSFRRIAQATQFPLKTVNEIYQRCGENADDFPSYFKITPDCDPLVLADKIKLKAQNDFFSPM